MLTIESRLFRPILLLLAAVAVISTFLLTTITPAAAEQCAQFDDNGNFIGYGNCDPGDDGDDGDDGEDTGGDSGGDDGGGGPQCQKPEIVGDSSDYTWCEGDLWCHGSEAVTEPTKPQPSPDHIWMYINCLPADWVCCEDPDAYTKFDWIDPTTVGEPEPPTLEERAVTAYGQLVAPAFNLRFDPSGTTYVGKETTFWAEGPTTDTFTGSEALGLVAQASDGQVIVTTGDGGTLECGWATDRTSAQANDCVKTYIESASFNASASLRFQVQFLLDGNVIEVPGLDDQYFTWEVGPQGTTVPVDEVQVIVQ